MADIALTSTPAVITFDIVSADPPRRVMPEVSPMIPWRTARQHMSAAIRAGQPDDVISALCRDYRVARAGHALRELVAGDPAPTAEQRLELAAVLVGGDGVAP